MNSKQTVNSAVNHKDCRVPVDLGSNGATGIHCSIVEKLRDYYDLEKKPVKIIEPYCMLGEIEEDLKQVLGVDIDGIFARETMFGFDMAEWKEWQAPWGQELLVPTGFITTDSEDGSTYIYPRGDMSVSPSGHMPEGGFFFDAVIRQEPIDDKNLDPENNLEEFQPASPADLDYYTKKIEELKDSERFILINFGGTAFGDIAMVPGNGLTHPKGIRDVTEWYMSTIIRRDYVHRVFESQAETALENLEKYAVIAGDVPGAVYLCGTDFGTQDSTFCSPETFDELYLPYYRRITSWIHENTSWKTMKHSCGAVEPLIPNLINAGFDILNPVQVTAAGMGPEHLKKNYGSDIVFWGGGMDTQKTLPFGTPEEVRTEALDRCEVFSRNGGFIFTANHNIQAKTPVENVAAMFEAVKEFNGTL